MEFIRRAAGRRGKLLQTGFSFGLEVHDHNSQSRDVPRNCQSHFKANAAECPIRADCGIPCPGRSTSLKNLWATSPALRMHSFAGVWTHFVS